MLCGLVPQDISLYEDLPAIGNLALFGVRIEGSVAGFVAIAIAFAILTATFDWEE